MISDSRICDSAKDALREAFKAWLDENRAEILRLTAEAVATRCRGPGRPRREQVPEDKPEPKSPPQPVFLTPTEVAERWHYHRESVRRLVRQGELVSVRLGGRVRVPLKEVERYEQEGTVDRRR